MNGPSPLSVLLDALMRDDQSAALSAIDDAGIQALLKKNARKMRDGPGQIRTLMVYHLRSRRDPLAAELLNAAHAMGGDWLEPLSSLSTLRPLRAFRPHQRHIKGIVLLPDDRILTGSEDGSMVVWNERHCERTLKEHSGPINALHSAGGVILSAGDDHTVRVWDRATLTPQRVIEGHTDVVSAVALAGETVVSVSRDGTVGFDGERATHHQTWATCVAVSPDGRWAITGSIGGGIAVWDVAARQVTRTLHPDRPVRMVMGMHIAPSLQEDFPHTDVPGCLLWPTAGTVISVGKEIVVWDTDTWTPRLVLEAHSVTPRCAVSLDDGTWLLTAGQEVRVWDLQSEEDHLSAAFVPHESSQITAMALSTDGNTLVTGDERGHVRAWDLPRVLNMPSSVTHSSGIRLPLLISPDERAVLSGGNGDHSAILWDSRTGRVVHHWEGGHREQFVEPIGFDGDRIVTSAGGEVCVWSWQTGVLQHRITLKAQTAMMSTSFLDGSTAITGLVGGSPVRWDLVAGTVTHLAFPHRHITSIIPLDADRLVVIHFKGSQDAPVSIIDRTSGAVLQSLTVPGHPTLRFSGTAAAGGRIFAAGTERVVVWDADSGAVIAQQTITGLKDGSRIWLLPDGRIAVLCTLPARLWLIAADLSAHTLHELGEILWYPVVSRDGTVLIGKCRERVDVYALPEVTRLLSYHPPVEACALALRGQTVAIGMENGRVLTFRLHRD